MKKVFLLFLGLTLTLTALLADQLTFSTNFNSSDFKLIDTGNGYKIEPKQGVNAIFVNENGQPDLPTIPVQIAVPLEANFIDCEFSIVPELVETNIDMTVVNDETGLDDSSIDKEKLKISPVRYATTTVVRCYKTMTFYVTPYIYDIEKRELSFISDIQLDIYYEMNDYSHVNDWDDGTFRKGIESNVINPGNIVMRSKSIRTPDEVKYLIITNAASVSEYQVLADWKTQKGISSEIVTIESIDANPLFSDTNSTIRIKNCINYYYTNYGTNYVLLGGDLQIIPSPIFVAFYGVPGYKNTDLFYACFDGNFHWNDNGDNCVAGPLDGTIDTAPEVILGRAPTGADGYAWIDKTIAYEQNPPLTNFARKVLLTAGHKNYNFEIPNYDALDLIDSISNYWSYAGGIERYNVIHTDLGYPISPSGLATALSSGYNIVHMYTALNENSWQLTQGTYFTGTDLDTVYDPDMQGIIYCQGNAAANFASSFNLGNRFLNKSDGGAVAMLGSTRPAGFYDNLIAEDFYTTLYNDNCSNRLGDCFNTARLHLSQFNSPSGSDDSNVIISLVLLGDPELPILTDNPSPITIQNLQPVGCGLESSVTIYTNVAGALVCLQSENDVYLYGNTDSNGSVTLTILPETFNPISVTVTAPNHSFAFCELEVYPRDAVTGHTDVAGARVEIPRLDITTYADVNGDYSFEYYDYSVVNPLSIHIYAPGYYDYSFTVDTSSYAGTGATYSLPNVELSPINFANMVV
ncbi:MAG: hypothetical protein JXR56_06315, partial [Candidatus Cloacimonetes bacterium]|nr:hypothetical protein [Candidatus Cloacimonadota bacterium]